MRYHSPAAALLAASFSLCAGLTPPGASAAPSISGQPIGSPTLLAQDPRHVVGELDNGLRYIVVRHSNPPERGLAWLYVSSGTLNETPKQRGAARLIQRMAFAGSRNFTTPALATMLQSIGSPLDLDALSHSTFEETVYKLVLQKSTPDAMEKALSFLADIPADLSFPDIELERERGTLISQIKTLTTPDMRIQDAIWNKIAPGSHFGERIPNVPEEALKALAKDDVLAYYRQWYTPANMTVLVTADMDPQAVVDLIKAKFGSLPKTPRPVPLDVNVRPYEQPLAIVATEPEMKQAQVYMFRLIPPHPPTRNEAQLREKLVQSLAIGAFNHRLNDKIAGGKVKFVSGSSLAVDIANVSTLVAVNASTELKDWNQTLASLATETQRVRLHGLPASDIDAVKKQYAQAAEQGVKQESAKVVGTLMAGIAQSVNNGDTYMSAEQTLTILNKLLPTVTKEELDAAFKRLFDPSAAAFVLASGGGPGTPTESELLSAGVEAFKVTPSADSEVAKPTALLATLPTPGKVAREKTHEQTGVETWTLDNGVVVQYLNVGTKKDYVNITVSLNGGLIQETPENHGITEAAATVWNRPATSTLTSSMIRELLQGKSVEMGGSAGVDSILFGISGKPADAESGMQVAHLLLTDPFVEPPAFDQWKRSVLSEVEQRATKPESVFNQAVHEAMFPETEFRLRPLTEAEVNKVTLEAANRWIKQIVAAAPVEVSIVGDISKDEAKRLALTYAGSLPRRPEPSAALFQEARTLKRPTGQRTIEREVDSPMQTAYLMLAFYAADERDAADRRALFISRAILEPRLMRSLRDQEQLVKGLQIRFDPGQEFPGFGLFRALAPVEPDKVEAVVKRLEDTFRSFAEVGPTPEELESIRKQALQSLEEVQKDPNYWTGELSLQQSRGKDLNSASGEKAAYETVTAADVKAAFAKYYGAGTTIRVVLRPKPPEPAPLPGPTPLPAPAPGK